MKNRFMIKVLDSVPILDSVSIDILDSDFISSSAGGMGLGGGGLYEV